LDIEDQSTWPSAKMATPIMPAAKTSMIQAVERTLRSFSHSISATWRNP